MQHGRRAELTGHDQFDRLQQVVEIAADIGVDVLLVRDLLRCHTLGVIRFALVLGEVDDGLDLFVGDERALHTDGFARAHREEEPVAHTDQLLGARLIQDDPGIGERRGGERQPRRDVGLDQTCHHVDGRPLRGQHEVDTSGTRLLGDTDDGVLHITRSGHHQIGELVHDGEDVRIRLVDPLRSQRCGDLPRAHLAVEVVDVTNARGLHVLVALLHLLHEPRECRGSFLRLRDDRGDQVRDALVRGELDHLGVDEDHPYLVGSGPGQQRDQHRVDEARLTGTGGTGDEQVGHLREVGGDEITFDVFTQTDDQRVLVLARRPGGQDVGEPHHLAVAVGDLDPHRGLTRDGCQQPHVVGCRSVRDVALQGGDLLHLHTWSEFHLVPRDRRPPGEPRDGRVDLELLQDRRDAVDHLVVGRAAELGRVTLDQQAGRRKPVVTFHGLVDDQCIVAAAGVEIRFGLGLGPHRFRRRFGHRALADRLGADRRCAQRFGHGSRHRLVFDDGFGQCLPRRDRSGLASTRRPSQSFGRPGRVVVGRVVVVRIAEGCVGVTTVFVVVHVLVVPVVVDTEPEVGTGDVDQFTHRETGQEQEPEGQAEQEDRHRQPRRQAVGQRTTCGHSEESAGVLSLGEVRGCTGKDVPQPDDGQRDEQACADAPSATRGIGSVTHQDETAHQENDREKYRSRPDQRASRRVHESTHRAARAEPHRRDHDDRQRDHHERNAVASLGVRVLRSRRERSVRVAALVPSVVGSVHALVIVGIATA